MQITLQKKHKMILFLILMAIGIVLLVIGSLEDVSLIRLEGADL
jgi:hypothetical protein